MTTTLACQHQWLQSNHRVSVFHLWPRCWCLATFRLSSTRGTGLCHDSSDHCMRLRMRAQSRQITWCRVDVRVLLAMHTCVEGLSQGARALQRDPAPSGAQPQNAAEAGRHPDAAACVAAHGKIHRAICHCHLRPTHASVDPLAPPMRLPDCQMCVW